MIKTTKMTFMLNILPLKLFHVLILTLSEYSVQLRRHWSRRIDRKLSRFFVSARARGRMLALSTSRLSILEPAARHCKVTKLENYENVEWKITK